MLISPYFNIQLTTHFARSGHIYIKKPFQCIFYFDGKNGKVIEEHSFNLKKRNQPFRGKSLKMVYF